MSLKLCHGELGLNSFKVHNTLCNGEMGQLGMAVRWKKIVNHKA